MFEESATHEVTSEATPSKALSRRQVIKAGAWAAPVVAVAVATPAASASSITASSVSARNTTGNNYAVSVTLTSSWATSRSTSVQVQIGGKTVSNTITVAAGGGTYLVGTAHNPNQSATAGVSIDGGSVNNVNVSWS